MNSDQAKYEGHWNALLREQQRGISMKKFGILGLAVAGALCIASQAFAGWTDAIPVSISKYGSTTSVGGSVGAARYSSDSKQYIDCAAQATSTGYYTVCYAQDSAGHSTICQTSSSQIFYAAVGINPSSEIYWNQDSAGTCTSLQVDNGSEYLH
jgi:hypothetical protein